MARRENAALTWTLRAFILLNIMSAAGFIAYALILENPPKTALPLGLLIVGIFSLVVCLFGIIGSCRIACCLNWYMVLGGALTLAELGLVLSMFFNYGGTVDNMVAYGKEQDPTWNADDTASLTKKVKDGRWFFLVVCILQTISVIVAAVLRLCIYPKERDFENFQEGEQGGGEGRPANSQIQMQKLQQSISGRQPAGAATSPGTASYASSKLYKSTTQRMADKYGDYSSDFKQKGWFAKKFGK